MNDLTTPDDIEKASARPLLRVASGHPTADELAAVVAVVAMVGARRALSTGRPAGMRRPAWPASARPVSALRQVGPGAWRASARPG